MNVFELIRSWFSWSFENPEKITPTHAALYFWIIDKNNAMGWKDRFGLPTSEAMEAIGIKSFHTYSKVLKDLVNWGFVKMIQKSKNQHTSNIIALPSALIKNDKALAKATSKQLQGKSSIDIPNTNYQIQREKESLSDLNEFEFPKENPARESVASAPEENTEAEELIRKAAHAVAGFFNISEINHGSHFIKISNFVRFLHNQGKIGYFRKQLKGYIELKKDSPPRYRHKWYNYIGSAEKSYEDGAWNEMDWWIEWKNTQKANQSENGEITDQTPVYDVNIREILAKQMEAIEADKAWYRKNRPEA